MVLIKSLKSMVIRRKTSTHLVPVRKSKGFPLLTSLAKGKPLALVVLIEKGVSP
jgi:hypothetical protein